MSQTSTLITREPILGTKSRVVGYRLRVGSADSQEVPVDDAMQLGQALDLESFEALTHGKLAFVRVSRDSLLAGLPPLLSPQRVVIELSSDIDDDRAVRAACARIKAAGYRLSISDFSLTSPSAGLSSLADYIKMNPASAANSDARARTVACFQTGTTALIATGVNTLEQWETAARDGFQYFQGFFFGRSVLAGRVSSQQMASLRLLRALNDPNLSMGQLEDLVQHDAELCYWLLRTVNSAAYGLPRTVISMHDALMMLGQSVVRRWASVWALASLNTQAHNELVVMSTVRARVCELLTRSAHGDELAGEAFLAGMLSVIDAILGRSMADVVGDLPLSAGLRAALCGAPGHLRDILDTAIAFERGQWDDCEALARKARVNARLIAGAYIESLRWAKEFQSPDLRTPSN